MRILPATLLGLSIALSGCIVSKNETPSQLPNSSSSEASHSEAATSDAISTGTADEKINEHHFFAILATHKDKIAANNTAKDLGAWVLPTNLTSGLTPDLYAVVYGPFRTKLAADEKLQSLLPQTREQIKNPYVKDAGKLVVPTDFQSYASSMPIQVLVAMDGRLSETGTIMIESQWREQSGTLCMPNTSAYVFMAMKNGKQVRDSMSPNEIALYKKLSRDSSPSAEDLQWGVTFDVIEDSGEVIGTQFCWD